jgi:D-alanyl-lipoteichoic acid acyltransferase DltB (MBOAT superfamily)
VFKPLKWQNLLVVIVSYIFYGWWDWRFLILIAITSLCSYLSGIYLEKYEGKRKRQKIISASNIVFNLAILGVFKYYNFFTENIAVLCEGFGYQLDWVTLDIILPVGISFYTFQALSYTIDVYRGQIKATHNIVEFFAFISFFPQLVAGPIERATNLLPQFQKERYFDYSKAVDGCRQMLWGFFKKMVVADTCAGFANSIWASYTEQTGFVLWIGALFFSFQIYCDFSGYSDIAIGTARLFGINLKRNFNVPYFSRSIPEFWRRWHISLMTWFRDYIYFPLGGSRCSKWKVIRNTIIVFGVSGLWHGANWTFVIWGLYHAFLIALFILTGINTKAKDVVASGKVLPSMKETFQILVTFILAVIGWVIFRAESINQAVDYLGKMFSYTAFQYSSFDGKRAFLFIFLMLIIEWLQRDKEHALQFTGNRFFQLRAIRWAAYYLLIISIVFFAGGNQTFIYFQF